MQRPQSSKTWWSTAANPCVLLLMAALAAIAPLLAHGVSCGQDLGFHIVSWLDAAQQLRHGQYPQWAVAPAWNAGEPRFIFYPPLSWLLGAVLTIVLPANAAPVAFIFLVLMAAGLSLYHLTRRYVSREAALLASAFYIGNPYMLFNAVERSAMAELMASAWIPLLLLGVLRVRPNVRGIAVPLALLWLTNAPAAVMGSYTLALIAILRTCEAIWSTQHRETHSIRDHVRFALTFVTGAVLGLALPAFYLVPAAYERRYVQVAMAIIPNMRFQDNFLFDRTTDAAHNAVNHTASLLALSVLALTVVAISGLLLHPSKSFTWKDGHLETPPVPMLAVLTFVIALLLVPISTPLWLHLPEFAFLQFPWRLLSILSAALAFAVALLLERIRISKPVRFIAPILTLALSILGYKLYAQHCEPMDSPTAIAASLSAHHGVAPTDEYTPTDADNDVLRTDNPGYWLASTPNIPAPHTVPTAAEINPSIGADDIPIPPEQTISSPAPRHLQLDLPQPAVLVFNLRDFPGWEITRKGSGSPFAEHAAHLRREDGLLAIPVPAGRSTIDVHWRLTTDQWIGIGISALALMDLLSSVGIRRRGVAQVHQGLA